MDGMKIFLSFLICLIGFKAVAQSNNLGIIIGTVLDEKNKALAGATVQLSNLKDSQNNKLVLTDKDGAFQISQIPFGYYRLKISYVGFNALTLDSIYFRGERYDFNMNDIVLKSANDSAKMDEVVIYFEKPLIQSKDGNITFNAGESALSAGSSAGELLNSVPLVTKDPDGKLMVRGKEPKILIDDKPVELNLQQLQDLLESMPGSSIEKIEVMTNPPPQYANEQGGVINIITKKGSVGKSGRFSVYGGTRGEIGSYASFNYRKRGFSFNVNAGDAYNEFQGNGYSKRQNIFVDSLNYFNTENNYTNKNSRPSFRSNLNYDINEHHSINFVLQYNQNDFNNSNFTENTNLNNQKEIYKLSNRTLKNSGDSYNPNVSLSYTLKTRKPGESLRLINNFNYSDYQSRRDFYQQYFNPDYTPNGKDSTQNQITDSKTNSFNSRLNYDLPLSNSKTFLSAGGYFNISDSKINSDASYLRKADMQWIPLTALINQFKYRQQINTARASVKQMLTSDFSTSAGISVEHTMVNFNLYKTGKATSNDYWNYLPFARLNKNWNDQLNLSFSYRRTIRRPGVGELNPTVDSSDAYTIRSGNTDLKPSLSHSFDLVLGRTHNSFYANIGLGYNVVQDVFAQIRTSLTDTTTQISWQNISARKEYEISTWSGYTLDKHTRVNLSASYTYNRYNAFDKQVRNYRDGGSFTSNLNGNYNWRDLYTLTGSFTYNRFASPQGSVKGSLSMNMGLQAKLLDKRFVVTFNFIDPFKQQQNRSWTYGTNYNLESFNTTQTRNFRLTLGYNFIKSAKKKSVVSKEALQNLMRKTNP